MKRHNYSLIYLAVILLMTSVSCKNYLDEKPDASLSIPKTLTDCQLLLDDYAMNSNYPSEGEAASDNFYVTDASYNSMSDLDARSNYVWDDKAEHPLQWSAPYTIVYSSNLVLKTLNSLPNSGVEYKTIKGTALFHRAFAFFHLAQLFTKPYDSQTVQTDMGIVLRTDPDVSVKYKRSTLKETYDLIVHDLSDAISLLPTTSIIQTRPTKAAAYAALARIYLSMSDYVNAEKMASAALAIKSSLMNFNSVNTITRFNPEVIFQAVTISIMPTNSFLSPSQAKIDKNLFLSYQLNDKRRTVFFRENPAPNLDTYSFKGSYDGVVNTTSLFTGLATDELYLIRAECYARNGKTEQALADLRFLMQNRYEETFTPFNSSITSVVLDKVLEERRKELVFRNQRWSDIRRLNKESKYAITLKRPYNTFSYKPMGPGDLRFAMLIPTLQETTLSNAQQNPR